MDKLIVIVAAAGQGKRMGLGKNKVFVSLGATPLIIKNLTNLAAVENLNKVLVVVGSGEEETMAGLLKQYSPRYFPDLDWQVVTGGKERQDSVQNALAQITEQTGWVAVHDGARPFADAAMFARVWGAAKATGAAIAAVPCKDTIKIVNSQEQVTATPVRSELRAVQTPQIFRLDILRKAYEELTKHPEPVTDDATLVEKLGIKVQIAMGSYSNIKITTPEDLMKVKETKMQIGSGFDVHCLVPGRKLILCGVTIPYEKGLEGHSDADVAVHALMDAMLGAAGLGDIGKFFPDNDPAYLNADSMKLLAEVIGVLKEKGWQVNNVDVTVIAQAPKLAPYRVTMKDNLMKALNLPEDAVNVKATTTEKLGFTGRGEGIAAEAVASLNKVN